MADIGFIGLGVMGVPMCSNLLKAGHKAVVYGRTAGPVERMVALGAVSSDSPRAVAEVSDVIFTMLPDGPEVQHVILGADGVLEGARPGSTIIDMSSVNPLVAQKIGAACAEKQVHFMDAPVSGGEPKAVDKTLTFMVGADESVFATMTPLLQTMGSTVTLMGAVGAGNFTKLANQIIVACNIVAMSEAFVLAARAGLDANTVFNAVRNGLAGSTVLNAKAPMVISRNFKPGFRIRLHEKDLRNALEAAESIKVALPITSAIQQMLIALMNQGKGDLDHCAIITFIEAMAGVEVA